MQAKYDADHNLAQRTAFQWTILRPGHLTHEPGTGRAIVGKAPLNSSISVRSLLAPAFGMTADC